MLEKKKYNNGMNWVFILLVALIVIIPITCTKIKNKPEQVANEDKPEYAEVDETEIPHDDTPIATEPVVKHTGKKLCVLIDDFGQNKNDRIEQFFDLPIEVGFAIMPDLPHSKDIMVAAMLQGREVIIHVPMEPLSYPKDNPGENAILTSLSDEEIAARMEDYINQLPNALGINNHMGSKATADKRVMKSVCEKLKENNMFFIDSFTNAKSVVQKTAHTVGIPTNRRHIFLDVPDSSIGNAAKKLVELEKKNTKNNPTIVITHCLSTNKLNQLKEFLRLAKEAGYELVHVSTVVEKKKAIM